MHYAGVATDPKLSAQAAALTAEQLEAEIDIAEVLLGFLGVTFTEERHQGLAVRAIALQVSYQLANPEAGRIKREKKGDQEIEWAVGKEGATAPVDPAAARVAAALLLQLGGSTAPAAGAEWSGLRSFR